MLVRLAILAAAALIAVPLAVSASHQFEDVPDSNIFHGDITWMFDNGITRGCNPPDNDQYCPDRALTRAEEAAFLHRLAKSRAVDAGTLSGMEASEFALAAEGSTDGTAANAAALDGKDSSAFLGSAVTIRTTTSDLGVGDATVVAECEAGEKVTGGGFETDLVDATITGSFPTIADADDPGAWNVTVTVVTAGDVTAYALCSAVGG